MHGSLVTFLLLVVLTGFTRAAQQVEPQSLATPQAPQVHRLHLSDGTILNITDDDKINNSAKLSRLPLDNSMGCPLHEIIQECRKIGRPVVIACIKMYTPHGKPIQYCYYDGYFISSRSISTNYRYFSEQEATINNVATNMSPDRKHDFILHLTASCPSGKDNKEIAMALENQGGFPKELSSLVVEYYFDPIDSNDLQEITDSTHLISNFFKEVSKKSHELYWSLVRPVWQQYVPVITHLIQIGQPQKALPLVHCIYSVVTKDTTLKPEELQQTSLQLNNFSQACHSQNSTNIKQRLSELYHTLGIEFTEPQPSMSERFQVFLKSFIPKLFRGSNKSSSTSQK